MTATALSGIAALAGRWALLVVTGTTTQVPVLGRLSSTTRSYSVHELTVEGDHLRGAGSLCGIQAESGSRMIHTVLPPSFVKVLPPPYVDALIQPEGDHLRLTQARRELVVGARLDHPASDPLPQSPDDPRVVDTDHDGHPGVTVRIEGLVRGDLYVVQRSWTELEGRSEGPDSFRGPVRFSSEQRTLDTTSRMLRRQSPAVPDLARSYFRLVRLPTGSDCSAAQRFIGWEALTLTALIALGAILLIITAASRSRAARARARRWLAGRIKDRFGGYMHPANQVDTRLPLLLQAPRSVVVIGGGLGGISAAANLAERGFQVTLFESSTYLGGKLGAWVERDASGAEIEAEHGFHAFFRHYYNLNQFLLRTGVSRHLRMIDDYLLLERDGRAWSFKDLETTPLLNLLALRAAGMYRLRDLLFTPARDHMDQLLKYDAARTFAALDGTSFRSFCQQTRLPPRLRLVFSTFARAFFADEDRLSMAELVKSFHFYYLSHDAGLLYSYPAGSYQRTVLDPIRGHLERHGVTLRLGQSIDTLGIRDDGFVVNGDDQRYDYAVLATSVTGTRALAERSPDLAQRCPELCRRLQALRPSQRYAVLRLYTDRDIRGGVPVFIATEPRAVLDAVAVVHRASGDMRSWADAQAPKVGGVFELHCYAVPDAIPDDAAVRALLIEEFLHHFPEMTGMNILREHLQVRADFTAFHTGMAAERPGLDTGHPALGLAADWVALPIPAMLMEAAYTAGLLSANRALRREGLQEHPVYSVPPRGILAPRSQRP